MNFNSPNTPQSKDRAPKISDGSAFATNVHHRSFWPSHLLTSSYSVKHYRTCVAVGLRRQLCTYMASALIAGDGAPYDANKTFVAICLHGPASQ